MKRVLFYIVSFILFPYSLKATNFIASQSGNWTSGTTWGGVCSSGCVAGVDYPSLNDNVYTNGFQITINANITCSNLFIEYNTPNSLQFNSPVRVLTIRGTLTGWDQANLTEMSPIVDVISDVTPGAITFTGANLLPEYAPYVIYAWDPTTVDSKNFNFNFSTGNTFRIRSGIQTESGIIRIMSGTLVCDPGVKLVSSGTGQLNIYSGALLVTNDPISGTSPTTGFSTIVVDGKLRTSSYANSNAFQVSGTLETSFHGPDQTEGWWYQNYSPTTLSFSTSGTALFNADATQYIPAATYNNVTLEASSSTQTKILTGTGIPIISGNLTIGANVNFTSAISTKLELKRNVIVNGLWTTIEDQPIEFNSLLYQSIEGNSIIFNGDVRLSTTFGLAFKTDITFAGTIIASTNNVNFNKNFINNGTFIHSNGTITFNGSIPSIIGGSSITEFYNINIDKSSALFPVVLQSPQRLIGTLTFVNGSSRLTTNGNDLTLVSNAAGTARIAAIPTGSEITGSITMQKYIPASDGRYWYMLGSPVSNATVQQLKMGAPTTGIYITGPFTGASWAPGMAQNQPSMYQYDAPSGTWSNYPKSSQTELLSPGVGYRIFIRDGSVAGYPTTTAKTISVTGSANSKTQVFPLHYSPTGASGAAPADGWNFLSNPYPSDISADLSDPAWTATGLAGTDVYIWDADASTYVSCSGGVGNCIIPSFQGFWVRANPGGGSLRATENVKTATSTTLYKKSTPLNQFVIVLKNNNSNISNSTYIRYSEDATNDFDPQFDAFLLESLIDFEENPEFSSSPKVSLSSECKGVKYTINTKSYFEVSDTIPLHVNAPLGINTLDFSDALALSPDKNIILIDSYKKSVTNLRQSEIYTFEVTYDKRSKGNRFSFVISNNNISSTGSGNSLNLVLYPNPTSEKHVNVIIENCLSDHVAISIIDLFGKVVYDNSFDTQNGKLQKTIEIPLLSSGIYTVNCKSTVGVYTNKLIVK